MVGGQKIWEKTCPVVAVLALVRSYPYDTNSKDRTDLVNYKLIDLQLVII